MTTTAKTTTHSSRMVTGRPQNAVPACPAADPVNAGGDRTTVIDGKLVVIPVEKPQQE
jgi:hypothetical protein